jgi:hypothetical protein
MACDPLPYDTSCIPETWPSTGSIAADIAAMTPGQRSAYDVAVELLATLAVRPIGTCGRTVRPCSRACGVRSGFRLGSAGPWFTPLLYGGEVFNVCGCLTVADCTCTDSRSSIRLPGPVVSVTQVRVDGVILDPADYTLDGNRLVRLDGGTWPMTQDLALDASADGTFEVMYVQGTPLSAGGRVALSALMQEIDKAMCGDSSCQLPARVTNVVREGVTYTLMDDPSKILDAGRTGIAAVDRWLNLINPAGTRTRMGVFSPDVGRRA